MRPCIEQSNGYRHSDLGRIAPSIRPDVIFGKDTLSQT